MVLARTADAMYWAGRYLERTEDMARIVRVHAHTHVDMPIGEEVGWLPLLEIFGLEDGDDELVPPAPSAQSGADGLETWVVQLLLLDDDNPSSIARAIAGARENFRHARAVVPREVFEACNKLWISTVEAGCTVSDRDARAAWLLRVIEGCQRVNGALWGSMGRDEAMAMLRIGQYLERADVTTRFLGARAASIVAGAADDPYDEVNLMSVLRSLGGYQSYRRSSAVGSQGRGVTSFLLADESFPRSVLSCGEHVTTYLAELPRSELPAAVCARLAEVAASSRDLDLGGLKALTDDLGAILGELHNTVEHTYFLAPESRGTVSGSTAASRESPAPFGLPPGEEPDAGGSLTGSAERRYRVVHRTTYSYEDEAVQSYNETHLRPRRTERQICVAHRLDVEPEPEPDGWSEYLDAFGNPVATFVVRGGFRKLEVIATSDVTVIDPPAINSTLPWESVRLLLEVDRQPAGREARRLRHGTRLVPISADLADYAAPSFAPGRPLVEAAIDLCHRIYEDFVYEPGFTSVTTPVHEVLDHRRGVCQDFGHVMTGCIRSLGLAARYVSGYVETFPPPGREHVVGADASHAWASVYVPGWGWMDLDPTNDQLVGSRYVTVAWGGDYGDVSPLRGSVEGGGRTHQLEVAVDVIPLEADVDSG